MKFQFAGSGTVRCSSSMVRNESEEITTLMFEPAAGNGELAMTVTGLIAKCGTGECVYSGSLEKLSVTGGEAAVIGVNDTLNEEAKSLLCPNRSSGKGRTRSTDRAPSSPIGATGPVFCTTNETQCPAESISLTPEFELLPTTELVITTLGVGNRPHWRSTRRWPSCRARMESAWNRCRWRRNTGALKRSSS